MSQDLGLAMQLLNENGNYKALVSQHTKLVQKQELQEAPVYKISQTTKMNIQQKPTVSMTEFIKRQSAQKDGKNHTSIQAQMTQNYSATSRAAIRELDYNKIRTSKYVEEVGEFDPEIPIEHSFTKKKKEKMWDDSFKMQVSQISYLEAQEQTSDYLKKYQLGMNQRNNTKMVIDENPDDEEIKSQTSPIKNIRTGIESFDEIVEDSKTMKQVDMESQQSANERLQNQSVEENGRLDDTQDIQVSRLEDSQ